MAKSTKRAVEKSEKIKNPGKLKRLTPKKVGSFLVKHWWKVAITVLVVAGFAFLANQYQDTKDQLNQLKNPKTAGQTEIQIITAEVSKSVDLPGTETPTLATVSDVSKLKNQVFFKNAENGDKVLIYTQAGKALLYRPSSKKVIEYSNVSLSNNSQQQTTNQ